MPKYPSPYKEGLRRLGQKLQQATLEIVPDPLGIARREQEEISKSANWAGYYARPTLTQEKIPPPPCTVVEYLKRCGTTKQDSTFISRMESYYSADPGVSNFKEEFLVTPGRYGVHLATLLPIAEIPYTREGIPTLGIVQPLDGIHWVPARTGNLNPGQHLQARNGVVGMLTD